MGDLEASTRCVVISGFSAPDVQNVGYWDFGRKLGGVTVCFVPLSVLSALLCFFSGVLGLG